MRERILATRREAECYAQGLKMGFAAGLLFSAGVVISLKTKRPVTPGGGPQILVIQPK